MNPEATEFLKYLSIALISLTGGMLFGFRSSGEYIFEIGNNFLIFGVLIVFAVFTAFCMHTIRTYYERRRI